MVVAWLVGAIVGLYFWKSDHGRLILLSVLTLGFAFSILSLTTARRHDVFSSTAAYAAVLVVFIGSTLDTGGDGTHTSSTVVKRLRSPRRVAPTRTYTAVGSFEAGHEDILTRNTAGELVGVMLIMGCVLICAFALLRMRKRGHVRL